jgi:hypothetical protein
LSILCTLRTGANCPTERVLGLMSASYTTPHTSQCSIRSSPENSTFPLRASRARFKLFTLSMGGHETQGRPSEALRGHTTSGRFKRFRLVHHDIKFTSLSRWLLGRTGSEGLRDSGCDKFDVMLASSGGSRLHYNMCDNIIVRVSSTVRVLRLLVWQTDPLRKTVSE